MNTGEWMTANKIDKWILRNERLFNDYPYAQCDEDDEATIIGIQQAEAAAEEARYEVAYQAKAETGVLELEEYAFDLLNSLADEFQLYDEGGIMARRIWDANTPAELQPIIDELQKMLLEAMRIKTVVFAARFWVGDGGSIEETLG